MIHFTPMQLTKAFQQSFGYLPWRLLCPVSQSLMQSAKGSMLCSLQALSIPGLRPGMPSPESPAASCHAFPHAPNAKWHKALHAGKPTSLYPFHAAIQVSYLATQ